MVLRRQEVQEDAGQVQVGLVLCRIDGHGRLQVGRLVRARGQEEEDLHTEVDSPV